MILATVILSGGTGTRLWPVSTTASPKQFLKIHSDLSFLQQAILRAHAISSNLIIIVTTEEHVESVIAQSITITSTVNSVPLYILTEPEARNTAPAIALSAHFARQITGFSNEDTSLLILPSDHRITPEKLFVNDVTSAEKLIKNGWITTFGIRPRSAATDYGYIELKENLYKGYRVGKFHEKPDLKTATRFLTSGHHLWNAGIFFSRLDLLLVELEKYAPNILQPLTKIVGIPSKLSEQVSMVGPNADLQKIYRDIENISFDYALMEKSKKIAAIKASFQWSDIGNWDELSRIFPSDPQVASIASHDNSVFSDLPVVLAGVDNLIVVVKNGSLLVTQKGKSHLTRDIIEMIKTHRPDLL